MTEPPTATIGRRQLGDLVPRDAHDRRDDELRDAHPARDDEPLATEVDERHPDLAAVIGVDRPWRVWNCKSLLERQAGSRSNLRFLAAMASRMGMGGPLL